MPMMRDILFQVPGNAQQVVDQVKANPVLLGLLVIVGIVTAFIFFWGIAKQAFKAAIFGGVLSFAAWYWYFNIR